MRRSSGTACGVLAAVVAVGLPLKIGAQEFMDVDGLRQRLAEGDRVQIETSGGEALKGRLHSLDPSSVVVRTGGAVPLGHRFSAAEVTRIRRLDSNRNGLLIGLAAGAAPGIALGNFIADYCHNEAGSCDAAPAIVGALTGLAGGWIGWAIDDAVEGGEVVYEATGPPSVVGAVEVGTNLTVRQTVGPAVQGLFEGITDQHLLVRTDEGRLRELPLRRVERLEVADSVIDGTLIGLGAGVGAGWLVGTTGCGSAMYVSTMCAATTLAIAVPTGAVVGFIVDKTQRRTVYTRKRWNRRQVSVSPVVSPMMGGVVASVSF